MSKLRKVFKGIVSVSLVMLFIMCGLSGMDDLSSYAEGRDLIDAVNDDRIMLFTLMGVVCAGLFVLINEDWFKRED